MMEDGQRNNKEDAEQKDVGCKPWRTFEYIQYVPLFPRQAKNGIVWQTWARQDEMPRVQGLGKESLGGLVWNGCVRLASGREEVLQYYTKVYITG